MTFNLPFRIALKDTNLSIRNDNRCINVIWFKRNGVISRHRNVLFTQNNSSWVKDDITHSVTLESPAKEKYWITEVRTSKNENIVGYIEDGVYGETAFHYCYTEVFFYIQYLNEEIPSENNLIPNVIGVFNYFLKVYRDVTSDINVSVISVSDLEHVNLFEIINEDFDIYNQTKTGVKVNLKPLNFALSWEVSRLIKPFVADFDDSKIEGIQRRIDYNYTTPLWFEILLEAKEQCFKYKNYDLSIVLLETSFEVFLDFALKKQMKLVNKSNEQIINGLNCPFLGKLKEQMPRYLNKKIDESIQEYIDWNECLYKKRNEIVHEGFKGVREEDVTKACIALIKLVVYIDNYSTFRGMI